MAATDTAPTLHPDAWIAEQAAGEFAGLTFVERHPDGQWLVLTEDGYEHGTTYDTLDTAVAWAWVWLTKY